MQLAGAVVDAGKAINASLAAAPLAIGVVPNPVGIANLVATAEQSYQSIMFYPWSFRLILIIRLPIEVIWERWSDSWDIQ